VIEKIERNKLKSMEKILNVKNLIEKCA